MSSKLKQFAKLVEKNRTFRRFYEDKKISRAVLVKLVDLARLSASSGNRQALKFMLFWQADRNALVFPCLFWAGYLKEWGGPKEGERPSAYIIILGDKRFAENFGCDHGIAAQSIMLGARAAGLGGCMVGAVDRDRLRQALDIARHFEILLVLALGVPKEQVKVTKVVGGNIKYWRDKSGRHYVPKRSLQEIIIS
jgi:nitroreductase